MRSIIRILAKDTSAVIAFAAGSPFDAPEKAEAPMPESITWMPAGKHAISAHKIDGGSFQGSVICDEQAARAVSASHTKIQASGQRVWIDFDHEDGAAAAWVKAFSWDPAKGILAHLEWTPKGEQAVRGKDYYSFSPAFEAEGKTGRVLGLIAGHAAGGLVNAPAFGAAMPALIAARFASTEKTAPGGNPEKSNMNELLVKLLAALAITAPANSTDEQLIALVAKHNTDNGKAASAASAEVVALKAQIALQAKAASEAVDATAKELNELKAVTLALQARGSIEVTTQDTVDVLAAYAAKDPAQLPADKRNEQGRADLAMERATIWAKHLKPIVRKDSLYDVISLAESRKSDVSRIAAKNVKGPVQILAANSLGTLSGSLIVQQSLSLLKAELPALNMFTSDFSSEGAKLGQSVITRTRGIPTVATYAGTYSDSDVTSADIPVLINLHRYSQFSYNVTELASTNRDLFAEQKEGVVYALGKDMLDAALAKFTLANYPAGAQKSIVALGAWNRAAMIAQRVALRKRKVQIRDGFAIMNEDYFAALATDATITSLATFSRPELINEYVLPKIAGFQPVGYVDMPTAGNLTAVLGSKESLCIAARLPYDYVDAQAGANYGNVSQITDPNTGLSVMLVQFVDHTAGASKFRVALMYGTAVGDTTRAQLVVSA